MAALTEEQMNWIADQTRRSALKAANSVRNQALIGFVILLVGIAGVIGYQYRASLHGRGVVCRIIKQGDYQAYQYAREGTITRAQLHRALLASQTYRRELRPADDCDTSFTKPPTKQAPAPGVVPAPHGPRK